MLSVVIAMMILALLTGLYRIVILLLTYTRLVMLLTRGLTIGRLLVSMVRACCISILTRPCPYGS